MNTGLLGFKQGLNPVHHSVRETPLQPNLRYLWIESNAQEALLVWVGNEAGPLGETSVWVSADGVIVRLVQGQLVGVSERLRSWRLTSETPLTEGREPADAPTIFEQSTDEQPGLRIGILRTVRRTSLPVAPASMKSFAITQPLRWFEVRDLHSGLLLSVYGLDDQNQTIVGQKCMTAVWCLRWRAWPSPSPRPAL